VAQAAARLKEAAKLGFARAVVPDAAKSEGGDAGLKISNVANLSHLVADIAALGKPGTTAKTREQDG
jgi:DNA repair protein RadA/Sms